MSTKNIDTKKCGYMAKKIVVLCLFLGVGTAIIDNVEVFSNFFAPTQEYWVEDTSSEWVHLEEELHFDSRFYQKSVVNNIHSVSPVALRIVSPTGEFVVDNLQLSQGEKATLEELEYHVEYEIFAKSEGEFNYLLFT